MGRKIGMREFRKTYGLHLLNRSSENYHPGQRVDFGLDVKDDRFQVKEESIVRELGISNELESKLVEMLKKIKLSEASFSDLEISRDFLIDADLDIPAFQFDLRGELHSDKLVRMSIDKVKVREVTDGDLRDQIEDEMERVRKDGGKPWRELKKKGIALKLFYAGSVSIEVTQKIDYDFGLGVKIEEIEVQAEADGNNTTGYKYSFGSSKCPFAVYFESVKEFIE